MSAKDDTVVQAVINQLSAQGKAQAEAFLNISGADGWDAWQLLVLFLLNDIRLNQP